MSCKVASRGPLTSTHQCAVRSVSDPPATLMPTVDAAEPLRCRPERLRRMLAIGHVVPLEGSFLVRRACAPAATGGDAAAAAAAAAASGAAAASEPPVALLLVSEDCPPPGPPGEEAVLVRIGSREAGFLEEIASEVRALCV